jgi:hypothetical protein
MLSRVVMTSAFLAMMAFAPIAGAQCPERINDCQYTNVSQTLVMTIRYVEAGLPSGSPYESAVLKAVSGGQLYLDVSFAWDTADGRAPPGQHDIPIRIVLESEDAELDPESMDVVYSANTTHPDHYFFEVDPEGDEVDVDFSITPDQEPAWTGTITWDNGDGRGPFGPIGEFFRDFWGWIVLFMLAAAAAGMVVGRRLRPVP